MTGNEAVEAMKAILALIESSASIHVYRRHRDRKIIGVYIAPSDGEIKCWRRTHKTIHSVGIDRIRKLVGGEWSRSKCFCRSIYQTSQLTGDPTIDLPTITRRAFTPRFTTQIYHQNPISGLLIPRP